MQEDEWQVEQNDESALGSNLFQGSSIIEGNGCIYTTDTGVVNDKELTGYIYYILLRDAAPGEGGIGIETVGNRVIISFLVKSINENNIYEYRYFEKEISQIIGME